MRKLMWFTIGFTAACAVGAYWISGNWLLLLALFSFALFLCTAFFFRQKGKAAMLLLLGLAAAFVWMWFFYTNYLSCAKALDGETVDAVIEITDYSEETDYGISADGTIRHEGKKYRIRVYSYVMDSLAPGDRISGKMELKYTRASNWSDYYSSMGIYLIGYLDNDAAVIPSEANSIKYFASNLRQELICLLDETFPEDTLAFARALLLGDSSQLRYETDTELAVSGIRHIVAVSGLHVSILFSLLYSVIGRRRILTPVIGLPLLALFAAVAGFTPSVTRACIMQALMILALLFDKEYDQPTALSFAVLAMLVVNPMTIASVGFQLSVGCIVGIFLFSGRIQGFLLQEKWLETGKTLKARLARWVTGSVSVTLSTMIVTTPLCAFYFGTVSLIGILTNILTLWVVSFLFCGIVIVCILGAVYLPAGKIAAWIVSWPVRYVLWTAKTLSSFPLAAVYTQSRYIVLWLVFCYIILCIFFLSKKKDQKLLLCSMILSLCFAVGASWLEPKLDDYRLTVLNVGQGQCILWQHKDKYYLIDCGGDQEENAADLAAQTLLSQGITQIDGLILTHYDKDHAGGAEYFLSRMPVDTLYLPNIKDDGVIQSRLIQDYYSKICWVQPESVFTVGDGEVTLFAGDGEKTDNESGLCILCQGENCDILITGDRSISAEADLLQQVKLPDLEVLVAGHHGSAYSTGRPLLSATLPEVAIISVGTNSYGHPAQAVLERLALYDCQVLRTDRNGTIVIRG